MILKIINADFSVCKVKDYSKTRLDAEFCFIGKTDEENSLVCRTGDVPENTTMRDDGWKGLRVEGPLDFSLIGILSKISSILAECESHQIKLPHKVADENRTPLYGAFFLPNPQFLYITLFFTGISNNFFVAENSENIFLMLRSPFCGNALCQHFFCRFQIFSMYPKKTTLHSAGGEFISSFEMSFRADFRFGLSGGG